jgi:hypothetical protein
MLQWTRSPGAGRDAGIRQGRRRWINPNHPENVRRGARVSRITEVEMLLFVPLTYAFPYQHPECLPEHLVAFNRDYPCLRREVRARPGSEGESDAG